MNDVRLRDGVRASLLVFIAVRVGLSLLSVAGVHLVEPLSPVSVPGWSGGTATAGWHNLWDATVRQDALWYLRIATEGYAIGDGSAAFFPVYPLAIRVVAWLPGVSPIGAALLIANACLAGALVVLHGLTRLEFSGDDEMARLTLLFLAIFPTAFFLMAPYSEAPFLLVSVATFWAARRQRWGWAAVLGLLAGLTRSIGVVVALALVVEALAGRKEGRSVWPGFGAAAATAAAPLLYLGWWGVVRGDAWAPFRAQSDWLRTLAPPYETVFHAVEYAGRFGTYWLIDLLVVAAVMVAIALGVRRLRLSYVAYAYASLLVPLFYAFPDRPLLSMPRFVVVIFPAFWMIADAVRRRRLPAALVTATFAGGYALLATLFINWRHIF